MRRPADLGLGSLDPFVSPSDIVGAYITLHNAVYRDGQFGPEVVFTAELLADQWDANGNAIPHRFKFSQSCEGASETRLNYVEAFATSREPIGPFVVVQLEAASPTVSGAIVLNDASDLIDLDALPQPEASGPGALARAARNAAAREVAVGANVSRGRSARPSNGGAPTTASPRGRQAARPSTDDDDLEDLPF